MAQEPSKQLYISLKASYKDPIQRLHAIYRECSDPTHTKMNIGDFEKQLDIWLKLRNMTLMNGSLKILTYFDSKFAQ